MKGKKTGGREKGTPNKSTLAVREAIAKLADGHAERFIGWIDKVAETDPGRAADLYLKAIEYHIPKLARSELTGANGERLFERIERQIVRPPNPNG